MERLAALNNWLIKNVLLLIVVLAVVSCKSYKANILFTMEEEEIEALSKVAHSVQENYTVSPNDQLQIEVFTNKGEKLIDQNYLLNENRRTNYQTTPPVYLVESDGTANLPVIGNVKLEGLTISEVNRQLQEKYTVYFIEPFVQTTYLNKRVIVLGGTGGQVIQLNNEGMNLLEVLALAGGVNNESKGNNIRLIRGPLSNPQVQFIDLSTIEGMTKANLEIKPNDIVYIEPVRRPFTESLKDVVPILSLLTSVLALVIAVTR